MRTLARLGLFGALLALVFGGAALAGDRIEPEADVETVDHEREAMETDGPERGHGGSAGEHGRSAGRSSSQAAAGLAVAEGGYRMVVEEVTFDPNRRDRLEFRILGPDGQTVEAFDEEHDREMHLIVVRRDTHHYRHLHPTRAPDGTWSVDLELPAAGVYRAYADFNVDGDAHTLATDLFAAGDFRPRPLPAPSDSAETDGYDVSLASSEPTAGEPAELAFEVTRDGRPVDDLQPYLGARGHLVALREGDLAFLHVHPEESHGHGSEDLQEEHFGTVRFAAEFPAAGRYRLYLQFRHGGEVRTVDYTVEVPR